MRLPRQQGGGVETQGVEDREDERDDHSNEANDGSHGNLLMATLYTARLIIVIPASLKDQANTFLSDKPYAGSDPVARARTFSVGLSPTGALPITHYWTGWTMEPGTSIAITNWRQALSAAVRAGVHIYDVATGSPTPDEVLALEGLQRIRLSLP